MEQLDFGLKDLDFLKFAIKLSDGTIKYFDVSDELFIDEENLNQAFIEQSGKYAWWGALAETAKAHREEMELLEAKAEANADKKARQSLKDDDIKVTEAGVKQRMKLDQTLELASKAVIKAKKNEKTLDRIVKAFEHRKDALVSISYNNTKERSQVNKSGETRSYERPNNLSTR